MFEQHDNMRPGPTPERVLTLCRLISGNRYDKNTIIQKTYLNPEQNKPGEEFASSLDVAEKELGVLRLSNGKYELAAPESVIKSPKAFRKWVANKVFSQPDTAFFKVSQWYLKNNDAVFTMGNWEGKAVQADLEIPDIKIDENSMLGWRFWAAFLGLGYLHSTTLIPNMYTRLKDVLSTSLPAGYSYGERIPVNAFLDWLFTKVPEAKIDSDALCLGLSNGFRTLRNCGEIEMSADLDAVKKNLFKIPTDGDNSFSHIIIKEAIR